MEDKKVDHAHEAMLAYQVFIRKELIIWFCTMMLSIIIVTYALVQWHYVTSFDYNRGYIAINDQQTPLKLTSMNKPHPTMSSSDIKIWLEDSLSECLTFDSLNYEIMKAYCSANVFSTNRPVNDSKTYGHLFYEALEDAEVIQALKSNNTSMTIEIVDSDFLDEGLTTYKKYNGGQQQIYTYNYRVQFKIMMYNQNLDAPIIYDIKVERMLESNRRIALGIRSVISR